MEAEHGWRCGPWVLATTKWREGLDGPKPESTDQPADDSLVAILKNGSAVDEAEGFAAAAAAVHELADYQLIDRGGELIETVSGRKAALRKLHQIIDVEDCGAQIVWPTNPGAAGTVRA